MSSRARSEMRARSGRSTSMPQIFINEQHIGGCEDLHALDADGRLDPLLKTELKNMANETAGADSRPPAPRRSSPCRTCT